MAVDAGLLGAEVAFKDHGGGGAVLVGGDGAGDDALPEPPGGVDECLLAACDRVTGEQDASGVGVDESLDDDGEGDAVVVEGVALAVVDGAGGPQRAPAAAHGIQDGFSTDDAEEGVLLPGEGRVGQVLGCGGGPYGHCRALAPRGQSVGDLLGDGGGDGLGLHRRSDGVRTLREQHVEVQVGDCVAVGVGGDDEAVGDGESSALQLAEVGRLATAGGQSRVDERDGHEVLQEMTRPPTAAAESEMRRPALATGASVWTGHSPRMGRNRAAPARCRRRRRSRST